MKFKVDENLPVELASELESLGQDADTVEDEGLCGKPDSGVVASARAEDRIIITLDKGIADVFQIPNCNSRGCRTVPARVIGS